MKRKKMMAGFLFTILIMVTLTGFATSDELKDQDETETKTDENLTTTSEECNCNLLGDPLICRQLRNTIAYCINQSEIWRFQKVNLRPDDPTWVKLCIYIARYYEYKASKAQDIYSILQKFKYCP